MGPFFRLSGLCPSLSLSERIQFSPISSFRRERARTTRAHTRGSDLSVSFLFFFLGGKTRKTQTRRARKKVGAAREAAQTCSEIPPLPPETTDSSRQKQNQTSPGVGFHAPTPLSGVLSFSENTRIGSEKKYPRRFFRPPERMCECFYFWGEKTNGGSRAESRTVSTLSGSRELRFFNGDLETLSRPLKKLIPPAD